VRETIESLEDGSIRDPMKAAAQNMKTQLPKRFYKRAEATETKEGFVIHLDGRPVRTPARSLLLVPSRRAGELLAKEWQAQKQYIDPMSMPVTRLVNTALDGVARDMQVVKEDITRFAGSDLLCYRADGPQLLIEAQQLHWDPLVDWAHTSLNARFLLAEGVMHITQPPESIAAIGTHLGAVDKPIVLAALHSITSLCGSAIIAMAVFKQEIAPENAWVAAHVDEDWQVSQWGEDSEAQALRAARKKDFDAAVMLLKALDMS